MALAKLRIRTTANELRRMMAEKDIRAPQVAEILGVTSQYIRLAMIGRRALSRRQLDRVQNHKFNGGARHVTSSRDRRKV
jgi:hypothetical protein